MELDVSRLLDGTVTVFNRLGAKEAGAKADTWHPCELSPANWSEVTARSSDGDGTVHLTRTARIQVPAGTGEYLPRAEWVTRAAEGRSEGTFTLSVGDFAVNGSTGLTGALTRSEMLAATEGMQRVELSTVRDLRNNGAANGGGSACGRYLSVLYAEGV